MTTLLWINLRALFSGIFMKSRAAKKRNPIVIVLIALLVVYCFSALFGMFGMLFYKMYSPIFSAGYGWFYFSFMGIAAFALCFIGSVFNAQAQIFNAKDNDLLLSLPVKPFSILLSRVVSLVLLEYVFEAFVVLPAGFVWIISQPVSVVSILFFIIAVLIIPLMAISLALLFAWLLSLITARLRNKNLITLVFWLIFFFAYFWAFSNIQKNIQFLIQNGMHFAAAVQKALFPAYHLGVAIERGSVVSMIIFVICALAPFILALLILSANFIKIATTNRGSAKIKYREKALKVSGVRMAFIQKELRHFLSNPMYILNTALGGLFMLIGAVLLVVKRDMVLSYVEQLNKTGIALSPAILVCVALSVISALNFVSAPSISLEGKNLWIAKSLPVPSFDILISKAAMHLLVCGTPAVVSALICAFFLKVTVFQFILMLLVPFLITVLVALMGVVINLQFPRFDWINEIQPIKQGVSSLLCMFGAFVLVAAVILLYVVLLSSVMSAEMYMLLCVVLFIALSGLLYGYLKNGGSRRFEALNN